MKINEALYVMTVEHIKSPGRWKFKPQFILYHMLWAVKLNGTFFLIHAVILASREYYLSNIDQSRSSHLQLLTATSCRVNNLLLI